MTYNIRALKDDRAALVRVIRSLEPDVLCLQEAPRHPFSGWRIARFARDCGMRWPGGQGRGFMSTTLLTGTRLRVLGSGHRRFPVKFFDEPRGWAYSRLQLGDGDVFTVASVHLSLRTSEHEEHARLLREDTVCGGPLVVAGDINELGEGPGWGRLADGMLDVGEAAMTFPAHAPSRCIDAIFSSPALQPVRIPVDVPEADLIAASDHRPLVVEIHPTP
nr:endonuclease/exonuclease/phosphatase family protein [Demetria terragena]